MDGIGRIAKRIAAAVWRGLRRWPKTTVLVLTPVVLLVVPVWPFFPSCGIDDYTVHTGRIYRYMSDDYRSVLKKYFRLFGVYYWDIGGIVFIRVLPFLDGAPMMNQDDGILNAQNRAAAALSGDYVMPSIEGQELNGRIYRAPPFIRKLVTEYSPGGASTWPYDRCDVMPYIITMEPPPAKSEQ